MSKRFVDLKKIPDDVHIYHYTKSNGVQGILRDRAFYATKSDFLNDTNEMVYTLIVVNQVLEEIPNDSFRRLLKEKLSEYAHIIERQSFFVTSFSVDPDSITLWAEFGDKTGYNLEFNSKELLDEITSRREIIYHGYLIYSLEEQKRILRSLIFEQMPKSMGVSLSDILEAAASDPSADIYNKFCKESLETISIYSLFFKQQEFAAEQEYRMVFKEKSQDEIRFREKDGFLMPYITIDAGDNKAFIKKITVAPKNHVDLAKAGMELFTKHYGYDVEVCLSSIHLRY